MSDDYSSSDGGSCDSGSSFHPDCSANSDPAPCSSSADVDRQFANDLLMYGMAAQLFTADSDSGTIRRERVAPEDFVIMRKDAEQRAKAYAEADRRAALRYGDPIGIVPETSERSSVWEMEWGPMIIGELDPSPEMKPGKVTWVTDMPCQQAKWSPWWRRSLFVCACVIATVALIKWWFP